MSDKIFIAEVPTAENDPDPFYLYFTSQSERDAFLEALRGHADSQGSPLAAAGWGQLQPNAAAAIAEIKHSMGWTELPAKD